MLQATDRGPVTLYLPTGGLFFSSLTSLPWNMSVYLFLKPIYLIQDHLMFSFSVEMPNSYVNPVKLLNAMRTCGNELIGYAHAVQLFFFFFLNQ